MDEVTTAISMSGYYFGLDEKNFVKCITEDMVFEVEASLSNKEGNVSFQVEGKADVMDALSKNHFSITSAIQLERLSFRRIKDMVVYADFASIETKYINGKTYKYRYVGSYTVVFDDSSGKLKVKRISLENYRNLIK